MPAAAEEIMVARDILLAELTGGHVHLCHMSTRGSVELIRRAKDQGLRVTAEACPHHFTLTHDACEGYNTNAKMNPPLREPEDREAIRQALRDGTIDVICTDHAPHHYDAKEREFDDAPNGIIGLETALGLAITELVEGGLHRSRDAGATDERDAGADLRAAGRHAGAGLGCRRGGLRPDASSGRCGPAEFFSKSRNTPFGGPRASGPGGHDDRAGTGGVRADGLSAETSSRQAATLAFGLPASFASGLIIADLERLRGTSRHGTPSETDTRSKPCSSSGPSTNSGSSRLDSAADKAPPAVRQRVRADYEGRLKGVIDELRGHAATISEELERHRGAQAELDRERRQAEEALAEAEVRHTVGEYTEDEWRRINDDSQSNLGRLRQELSTRRRRDHAAGRSAVADRRAGARSGPSLRRRRPPRAPRPRSSSRRRPRAGSRARAGARDRTRHPAAVSRQLRHRPHRPRRPTPAPRREPARRRRRATSSRSSSRYRRRSGSPPARVGRAIRAAGPGPYRSRAVETAPPPAAGRQGRRRHPTGRQDAQVRGMRDAEPADGMVLRAVRGELAGL